MVKLNRLLGHRPEVHVACMYTKHKTQKKKTWHDGFVSLYASRRVVLYDEMPPDGTIIEDAKLSVNEWDRKDDDYVSLSKFLVDILDPTPIELNATASSGSMTDSSSTSQRPEPPRQYAPGRASNNPPPPRSVHTKFKSPLGSWAPPRPKLGRPLHSNAAPTRNVKPKTDPLDFQRNPTSQWQYVPHAVNRSAEDIAIMLDVTLPAE